MSSNSKFSVQLHIIVSQLIKFPHYFLFIFFEERKDVISEQDKIRKTHNKHLMMILNLEKNEELLLLRYSLTSDIIQIAQVYMFNRN